MSSRGDTSAECSCNVVLGGQRNIKSIGLISSKRTRRAEVTISSSVVALGSSVCWPLFVVVFIVVVENV